MGWKSKPYWLKGGIILLSIALLILLYLYINFGLIYNEYNCPIDTCSSPIYLFYIQNIFSFGLIFIEYLGLVKEGTIIYQILFFILNLTVYFLIGSIIGRIYGKFKSKKSQ